jgi:hypothetical protein
VADERELFFREGAKFLAPGSVGSSLHWFVRVHTYEITHGKHKGKRNSVFNATIHLSDCDRRISWGAEDIGKIDAAINELQRLRRAVSMGAKVAKAHKLDGKEYDE